MSFVVSNMQCDAMNGTIFDIKEFTVHDGPGARVTVFMKGCPLRCVWCHNPEGLDRKPELMHRRSMCVHCGNCKKGCDHPQCQGFDRCVLACPNGCLSIAGEEMTPRALADRLSQYVPMLNAMGGGITFSGGEPLLQGEFLLEVMALLPDAHIALQTSGYALSGLYSRVAQRVDYVLQDLKLADPGLHKDYTGVDNQLILENVRWLKQSGKPFVFRVPLIPGITDTAENLNALARITEDYSVELMPYNPMAGAKYPMVGRTYTLKDGKNREEDYKSFFSNAVIL